MSLSKRGVNPWPFDTIMPPIGYALGTVSANTIMLQRCPRLNADETITKMTMFVNTGGAAGNVDLGYYSDDNADGTYVLEAHTGDTVATASNAEQQISLLAPFIRSKGRDLWRAFICNNVSLNIYRATGYSTLGTVIPLFSIGGAVTYATASGLPATISGLTGQNIIPLIKGLP